VLKTHIDILPDLTDDTIKSLVALSKKHNFLIFEDRKFVDIGATVQKQYHGGTLKISAWADIVNCVVLAGEGIVQALEEVIEKNFGGSQDRGVLILAEMTSKGSLAIGKFTQESVEIARRHSKAVIGFVAMRSFSDMQTDSVAPEDEDFVVFTTGINLASKGDALGQQYNTPAAAIERGADLLIVGRGIYASQDPVEQAKTYRDQAWEAYLQRIEKISK
jgi:orotidine-5'-phosphate decarboxylase